MRTASFTLGAALVLALVAAPALARVDKADVSPAGMRATVTAKGHTLLLITSPDPKCRYCQGQAALFDELARNHAGDLRMRRVQWSPWHKMPPAQQFARPVGGLPAWQVFRDGRIVAEQVGAMSDAAALAKFVDDAVMGRAPVPAEPTPAVEAASAPGAAAAPVAARRQEADARLSEPDRQALAAMARRDLARAALQQCGQANPNDRSNYEGALLDYEARHKAALNRGTMLLLTRTDPGSAREMDPIVDAETRRLSSEAPMRSPTPQACRQLAEALMR